MIDIQLDLNGAGTRWDIAGALTVDVPGSARINVNTGYVLTARSIDLGRSIYVPNLPFAKSKTNFINVAGVLVSYR